MAFVMSANLHRRNLSESQRSVCAAKARDWYDDEAKKRQKRKPTDSVSGTCHKQSENAGRASDKAGEKFGVSGRSVFARHESASSQPEQVCDLCIAAAERGEDWRDQLAECVTNDPAERRAMSIM